MTSESDAPLPPPGAESQPEPRDEPVAPVEAATVDVAPEPVPEPGPMPEPEPEPAAVATYEPTPPEPRGHEAVAEEHHHDDDDEGSSLAAKLLTGLVLLLAGAAIGVWGAPKLAPLLPSGMKPVADWLAPSSGAEAELAALRSELDQSVGGVQARVAELPSAGDVDQRIAAAVTAAQGALSGQIDSLQQAVGQIDPTAARQQLDQLGATVQSQAAELSSIKEQLQGGAAAVGQLGSDTAQKIDVYRADLEGLRAQMGTLQGNVSALATRIDEVAANADRQIETAQTKVGEIETRAATAVGAAEAGAAAAAVRAAVASGQPFAQALDALAGRPDVTVPPGLADAAATGAPTLAQLRDSFPDAAHAAIRASIMASAGTGVFSRAKAFVEAQVSSRSLTPQAGQGPDAVLSRMEDRLRQGDLKAVLAESAQLPSEATAAMQGWLDAARSRLAVEDGIAALDATLPATN